MKILSSQQKKSFDKTQHPFMIKKKNSLESEHRGNIPIIIKVTYDKPMANISAVKR